MHSIFLLFNYYLAREWVSTSVEVKSFFWPVYLLEYQFASHAAKIMTRRMTIFANTAFSRLFFAQIMRICQVTFEKTISGIISKFDHVFDKSIKCRSVERQIRIFEGTSRHFGLVIKRFQASTSKLLIENKCVNRMR